MQKNLHIEFSEPCCVLDIEDGLVTRAQLLQAMVEHMFDLQEQPAELWTLAATEDWQLPLLTFLPASKLMLTVTHLREDQRQ